MLISEYIAHLQAHMANHGDVEVYTTAYGPLHAAKAAAAPSIEYLKLPEPRETRLKFYSPFLDKSAQIGAKVVKV